MNFKDFIEKPSSMKLTSNVKVSENLKYHLDKQIPLSENVFRIYSKSYFDLINEVRSLYENDLIELNDDDTEMIESNLGESVVVNGELIYLDAPLNEDEVNESEEKDKNVKLNKPVRTPSGPKKFKVYVKSKDGKVKLVRFGDSKKSGLSIKNSSPARAKSFRARHKCSEKKDRTTPGYWSCNVARYAKSLGLKSNKAW